MLAPANNLPELHFLETFARENYDPCEIELDVVKSEIVIKSRIENIFDIQLLHQLLDEFPVRDIMLLKFDSLQYRKAFQNRLIISFNGVIEREFIKENYIQKPAIEDSYFIWDKCLILGIEPFHYSIFGTRPTRIYSRGRDYCFIGRLK
jgi:hypothetical protein